MHGVRMGTRNEQRFQAFLLLLPHLCQDRESVLADVTSGDGSVFCAVTDGFPPVQQLLADESLLSAARSESLAAAPEKKSERMRAVAVARPRECRIRTLRPHVSRDHRKLLGKVPRVPPLI